MNPEDFKEIKEDWGSEYEITEGEYAGHRLSCKVVVERIYPQEKKDDASLPRFKVSNHVVIRVLPPKKET